jgi:adenosylcobinamide kinase/adenosylcobinamide-phosphate guanylyltransferase
VSVSQARSRRKQSRRGRLIFVIGGASSGKSTVALTLAGTADARAFVATGQALDQEMAERIQRHQASRDADWETAEVPVHLAEWFRAKGGGYRVIVLDCLTLWLMNLQEAGVPNEEVARRVTVLLEAIEETCARVVIVSNELGWGLVPDDAGARRFRDLAGQINQQTAKAADEVYLVVSGLPVAIKPAVRNRLRGKVR